MEELGGLTCSQSDCLYELYGMLLTAGRHKVRIVTQRRRFPITGSSQVIIVQNPVLVITSPQEPE